MKSFKFIEFDIKYSKSIEISSFSQIVEVITCVENNCIIVENINIITIKEIIKKLEHKKLKIISIECAIREDIFLIEEIVNFESKFKDEIKNNKFVEMTISSIITYPVQRFFFVRQNISKINHFLIYSVVLIHQSVIFYIHQMKIKHWKEVWERL